MTETEQDQETELEQTANQEPEAEQEQTPPPTPTRKFPLWIMIAGGGLLFLLILAGLVIFVVLPMLTGPSVRLDAANPTLVHPDGLAVQITDGSLKVGIESIPRDTFLNGEAGRSWQQARDVLPPNLAALSPVYTIEMRGEGQLVAEMAIPNGADPLSLLDLYRWDSKKKQWLFVPSQVDATRDLITFSPEGSSMHIVAVHAEPQQPEVGVVVSVGGSDVGSNYGLAIPEGVVIDAEGHLTGEPVEASASVVLPLVQNRKGGFLAYTDAAQRGVIIDQLMGLVASYDGLVLDFDPGEGYADFIAELAKEIHSHGKRLDVIVHTDTLAEVDDLSAYVDRFWLAPGDNPTAYLPNSGVQESLAELVGRVNRQQAGLLVSGLTVDVVNDSSTIIPFDQALELFGTIEPFFDPAVPLPPESELPFRLSGKIDSMGFDVPLGMNYLTYYDESSQLHYVYFGSAQNLQRRLAWARTYGLGGVAVYGLAHPDAPAQLADGLSAFLGEQQIGDPEKLAIVWRVDQSQGGRLNEDTGDLSFIQYMWKAVTEPGKYVVSAVVRNQNGENDRGSVEVQVAEATAEEPVEEPTPTATPEPVETEEPDEEATPEPEATPVTGSIAAGSFELGGQTHTLEHPDLMRHAGMNWVKFQHKWGDGDDAAGAVGGRISQAHSLGFKVLLSIPGGDHPTDINYGSYVNFLAGVAALGPDAIEIWNEQNIDREWPHGQIDGANYVNNMLAPAYQAIKAANPDVMVISGAPAPTGFWGGCSPDGCDDWFYLAQMRDAGAANYMDCVGVHYNEGIIPPSQKTGDPRSEHYTRYFSGMLDLYYSSFGKPVCFTELGFLSSDGYGALPDSFSWAQDTSVDEQAAWLAEAAVLSSQSGKVRLMIVFNVDFTVYGSDPQGGYAMIRPGGSCPACDALNAVQP